MTMKPSYTQPSTASQIVPLRHWKTGGTLNASRSKGISLFPTRKSALHALLYIRLGLNSRAKTFHTPSEGKEDYSACMLHKAEQTLLRL